MADYKNIAEVVKEAFEFAEHSDGNEHLLVEKLKDSSAFVPSLSLVACDDKKIIGHIMFTEGNVEKEVVLILAPLSVLPSYQRKGVGKSLIRQAHRLASDLGYNYSIVLGDPQYYKKLGYIAAKTFDIFPPAGIEEQFLLACTLSDGAPKVSGVLNYPKEFNI
ncbi:N-acetyltransferase [Streptococcus suis]|nr:N-acetyltransferase [Streptococcus suis]